MRRSLPMLKKTLSSLLLALLVTGCAGTFTNLTPTQQFRNETGLYPVEVAYNTRQAAVRWDSIQPYIIVDNEAYPMRATPLMTNRWEGLVPVPADVEGVNYRYKLEFDVRDFGGPKPDSRLSKTYQLRILDE